MSTLYTPENRSSTRTSAAALSPSPTSVKSLPIELLEHIYNQLSSQDISLTQKSQQSFRSVSRDWRGAAHRQRRDAHLSLYGAGWRLKALTQYLQEAPTDAQDILSLRIDCVTLSPEDLEDLLDLLPNLRRLYVACSRIRAAHFQAMASTCSNLISLSVMPNSIWVRSPTQSFDFKTAFPALQSIGLDLEMDHYLSPPCLPTRELSTLLLPSWARSLEQLRGLLTALPRAQLHRLALPFDRWNRLTRSEETGQDLQRALEGLRELQLTPGILSRQAQTAEHLSKSYVDLEPHYWPPRLKCVDFSCLPLSPKAPMVERILRGIGKSRPDGNYQGEGLDLVLAGGNEPDSDSHSSIDALSHLITHDSELLDFVESITFAATPYVDSWDTTQEAEECIKPLIGMMGDTEGVRFYYEDEMEEKHRIWGAA